MRAWMALVLVLGLVACASGRGASAVPSVRESPPPSVAGDEPARISRTVRLEASGPHRSEIAVLDVVQLPSSESGERGFALLLRGDVGLSAVLRSLRIWAFTEPVAGGSCTVLPGPVVLHPSHEDAMQPALADETRTLVVRSRGDLTQGARSWGRASFRYGPLPSLNGDFEGWVSFQFPATPGAASCAFEVRGVVTVVAGESTSAVLPVVRIESRHGLEGSDTRYGAATAHR